jgi:hypothetical protein
VVFVVEITNIKNWCHETKNKEVYLLLILDSWKNLYFHSEFKTFKRSKLKFYIQKAPPFFIFSFIASVKHALIQCVRLLTWFTYTLWIMLPSVATKILWKNNLVLRQYRWSSDKVPFKPFPLFWICIILFSLVLVWYTNNNPSETFFCVINKINFLSKKSMEI